ncbi:protein kinase-like protein [Apiospora phragmitis]|uniref:Protein kinase-like protein n=1 Tax=Apiospora phragmitis TaxID=2905665 RepID=A0ABR1VU53_9PEZI
MPGQHPVQQLVQMIDDNSWIIGDHLLLTRQLSNKNYLCSWSDGNGSFYALSDAPWPLPPSRPLSPTSPIQRIHEAGECAAVWRAGDAFLKVRDLDEFELRSTREHVTLAALHKRSDLSFTIPECLYYALWGLRYFMVPSKVPGELLDEVWPTIDESRRRYYVHRAVSICKELEKWEADYIGGVDGKELSDRFMRRRRDPNDFSRQNLAANAKELSMNCSSFKFYHCDMGPRNLLVNTGDRTMSVIDWETAGFVPREWIRTKFHISSGLDLKEPDATASDAYDSSDWRVRVGRQLGAEGFPEVIDNWIKWWS